MEKTRQSFMPTPSCSTRILLWHSDRRDGLHDVRSHGHLQGCRRNKADQKGVSSSTAQPKLISFHVSLLWPHSSATNSIRQYCRGLYLALTLSGWPEFSKVLSAIGHKPCWACIPAGAQEPHLRNRIFVPPCPGTICRVPELLWRYCWCTQQA